MSTTPNVPAAAPVVPEYLKKYMAQPTAEADSLASSSMSVPRVSLRGRTFRFIEGGEEREKFNDNIDIVILGVEPEAGRFIKTYYDGVYNSGDSSPPTCASSNGLQPDPWVTAAQSQHCATCPKNQFGSATSRTGKKSKACRDSKRIWIVKPDAIDETVYGLNVPVTSLKSLSEFGVAVKESGAPLSSVIVRIGMTDAEYPLLTFSMLGFLAEEYGEAAMKRNESKDWMISRPTAPQIAAPAQNAAIAAPAATVATPKGEVKSPPPLEGDVVKAGDGSNVDDILQDW